MLKRGGLLLLAVAVMLAMASTAFAKTVVLAPVQVNSDKETTIAAATEATVAWVRNLGFEVVQATPADMSKLGVSLPIAFDEKGRRVVNPAVRDPAVLQKLGKAMGTDYAVGVVYDDVRCGTVRNPIKAIRKAYVPLDATIQRISDGATVFAYLTDRQNPWAVDADNCAHWWESSLSVGLGIAMWTKNLGSGPWTQFAGGAGFILLPQMLPKGRDDVLEGSAVTKAAENVFSLARKSL
jgi:hypothetical protein